MGGSNEPATDRTAGRSGDRRRRGGARAGEGNAMTRFIGALLAAMALAWGGAVEGQNFPTRQVTLVVPWPAGGTTDVVMRALATATEKHLGQSLVIENRSGAAGTLGPGQMAARDRKSTRLNS